MDRQPWERQPWQTPTAFERFRDYYLSQEEPRSVDQAYRDWYADQRGLQRGCKEVAKKRAPGIWQAWSRGQDREGRPIPGARTWRQMADAWNDHLAQLDEELWEQRRREVREADWKLGDELRKRATQYLRDFQSFRRTSVKEVEGEDGGKMKVVALEANMTLPHISGAAKVASDLQRLSAEMETEHKRHSGQVNLTDVTSDEMARAREKARALEEELLGDDE